MQRLRQDLLDVASIEAGRLAIEPEPQEVAALAREALEAAGELSREKSLTLTMEVPADTPPSSPTASGSSRCCSTSSATP